MTGACEEREEELKLEFEWDDLYITSHVTNLYNIFLTITLSYSNLSYMLIRVHTNTMKIEFVYTILVYSTSK